MGEEIVTLEDLRELLEREDEVIAYDGYEPSGLAHIPFLLRAINLEDLLKAKIKFKLLLADWHAYLNNKMGGDIEKIRNVGRYFIEVYKACGVDFSKVELIWAGDLIDKDYMELVLKIAKNTTLKRMFRCLTIMGRRQTDILNSGQLIYPAMQCADIFTLNAKICQLGLDQRNVNMLAREIGERLGFYKPVVISHHMLMGLQPTDELASGSEVEQRIAMKMSKSKPETCIYLQDSSELVKRKILKAYCPPKIVKNNPILDYTKHIIFRKRETLEIKRPQKYGGKVEFSSYEELERAYTSGEIHPLDLKNAIAKTLNELLEPVRKHLEKEKVRRLLEEG